MRYIALFFSRVDDIDSLLHFVESSNLSISDVIIDDNRRRHVTILMSERGSWTTNTEAACSLGLNKENKTGAPGYQNRLLKRSIKRSKSVINMFISTSSHSKELELQKAKNIKQTENLITLRDAILRVANYFFSADPNSMPTDPDLADELQVRKNGFHSI